MISGNNDPDYNDRYSNDFSAGDFFLQYEISHQEDPDKDGSCNTGHDRHRHMDQSDLVNGQCQEKEPVGQDHSPVEKFPDKAFLCGLIGLHLQQDLAEGGKESTQDGQAIAKLGRKKFRTHQTYSPPFQL